MVRGLNMFPVILSRLHVAVANKLRIKLCFCEHKQLSRRLSSASLRTEISSSQNCLNFQTTLGPVSENGLCWVRSGWSVVSEAMAAVKNRQGGTFSVPQSLKITPLHSSKKRCWCLFDYSDPLFLEQDSLSHVKGVYVCVCVLCCT